MTDVLFEWPLTKKESFLKLVLEQHRDNDAMGMAPCCTRHFLSAAISVQFALKIVSVSPNNAQLSHESQEVQYSF
jgi:hypothetical protein